jgi:maleate isomerase
VTDSGSWRGDVGVIKPTYHAGSLEEFIRLLPEGIGVVPLFLGSGIEHGTVQEFSNALGRYEPRIQELARLGMDLIHPEGGPVFMTLGYQGEERQLQDWAAKYGVPLVTSGRTQILAMKALGIERAVGVTYTNAETNVIVQRYFQEAGIDLVSLDSVQVPFEKRGYISPQEVYAVTRTALAKAPRVDGVLLFGSGWRSLGAVPLLEQDLGLPVVHATPARVWAVQRFLGVRQPARGYGRLLEQLPDFARDSVGPGGI